MDFVIPVALGELLAEMHILTAIELNRHRTTSVGSAQAVCAWTAGRCLEISELMFLIGSKV